MLERLKLKKLINAITWMNYTVRFQLRCNNYWASEESPTLGCSGITWTKHAHAQSKERLRIRRENEKIENHEKQRLATLKI